MLKSKLLSSFRYVGIVLENFHIDFTNYQINVIFFYPAKHVCHLTSLTDAQLNQLLNNIVDMENLYISISRQEDNDIKKV